MVASPAAMLQQQRSASSFGASCSGAAWSPSPASRQAVVVSVAGRRPRALETAATHKDAAAHRLSAMRSAAPYCDATHASYYGDGPVAGPKKLRKLTKRMKRNAAALKAMTTQMAEVSGGLRQQQQSDLAAASMLEQWQSMQAEFLAMCDAAIDELESSSSSSSSESDGGVKQRRRRGERTLAASAAATLAPARVGHAPGSSPRATTTTTADPRVTVCMGSACRRRGADQLLQAFSSAAAAGPGADVAVATCKCMGKCKAGPAAKLQPGGEQAGVALHLGCDASLVPDLMDTYFPQQQQVEQPAQDSCFLLDSPPAEDDPRRYT